jgi:hypothetical protein
MTDNFVRIELDVKRKLRFRHKDLRDAVKVSGQSIGALFSDPFGGWPYLLLYALRHQDVNLDLDKCSEFIDLWVERHAEERQPMDLLGKQLLAALNASGFVKVEAETKLEDGPTSAEGNAKPPVALG